MCQLILFPLSPQLFHFGLCLTNSALGSIPLLLSHTWKSCATLDPSLLLDIPPHGTAPSSSMRCENSFSMNVQENLASNRIKLYSTELKSKLKLWKIILLWNLVVRVQRMGVEVASSAPACGCRDLLFPWELVQVECTLGFMREQLGILSPDLPRDQSPLRGGLTERMPFPN